MFRQMSIQDLMEECMSLQKAIKSCPPLNQAVDDTEILCRGEMEALLEELARRGVSISDLEKYAAKKKEGETNENRIIA